MKNINSIIKYFQENEVSNEDWERVQQAVEEFNHKRLLEHSHSVLINDVKRLLYMYDTDESFRLWCKNVLDFEQYQEYKENSDRKYPDAIINKADADTPSEDYCIPCINPGFGFSDKHNVNPFLWNTYTVNTFFVDKNIDKLICDGDSGKKAFAVFWHGKFNTLLTPEFVYNCDYPHCDEKDLLGNNIFKMYYKRNVIFDLTLWNFKELEDLYREVNDIL